MIQVGQIIEELDRTFIVEGIHRDEDGVLCVLELHCITPKENDSEEWSLSITDESKLVAHTIH